MIYPQDISWGQVSFPAPQALWILKAHEHSLSGCCYRKWPQSSSMSLCPHFLFIYLFICILIFIYIGSRVVSDVLFVLGVQELDSVMYRSFLRFFSHIDYYIVFSRVPSEKAMASHSSTLAWKIPWMEEPGRLQSMGSLRVGHHWATSLSLFTSMHWRRKWQPTPVFLPGESQGWGSLVGCRLWGCTESDTTEAT